MFAKSKTADSVGVPEQKVQCEDVPVDSKSEADTQAPSSNTPHTLDSFVDSACSFETPAKKSRRVS
eukprot:4237933-Pyramimonas_sp.AAC.1